MKETSLKVFLHSYWDPSSLLLFMVPFDKMINLTRVKKKNMGTDPTGTLYDKYEQS